MLLSSSNIPSVFENRSGCLDVKDKIYNKLSTSKFMTSFTQCFHTIGCNKELEMFIKTLRDTPREITISQKITKAKVGLKSWNKFENCKVSLGRYDSSMNSVENTLRYVFKHFKKGIYVQIRSGNITKFAPFSNIDYENILTKKQVINAKQTFHHYIKSQRWLSNPKKWYLDGCLVKPKGNWLCNTPDWYYAEYFYILSLVVQKYKTALSDNDFILNTGNFPLFYSKFDKKTKNRVWCHPHDDVTGQNCAEMPQMFDGLPCPVLSPCKRAYHNDIFMPGGYDISMACSNKVFLGTSSKATGCKVMFPLIKDDIPFTKKKDKIVWRGSLSNCSASKKTSCRLKVASIRNQDDYLDAKITDTMSDVPRKETNLRFLLKTPVIDAASLGEFKNNTQQLLHKYILVLGGTISNSSMAYYMQSNSIIVFGGNREYKMWIDNIVAPNKHYIPFNCDKDVDDLSLQLKNIVEHGKQKQGKLEYNEIKRNANKFFKDYVSTEFIVDYFYILLNSFVF
jgi:hypothetical protein